MSANTEAVKQKNSVRFWGTMIRRVSISWRTANTFRTHDTVTTDQKIAWIILVADL